MVSRLAVAAAAFLALCAPASAAAADSAAHRERLPLATGIDWLASASESREGYQRTSFKHWVDADRDGCSTRAEVLIAESVVAPTVEPGCKVTAGEWRSYYDGVTVTAPGGLDIDHMVPLAEAWDSGASSWTAQRRQDYANDLDAERSLVAVTARTNRSKADQDPAEWLPPLADARCTYVTDWVATKLRWNLTVDDTERAALTRLADECDGWEVTYEPAP
ncbi:HNH endonuclease family protein [Streptomyces canus]|uniref:HNH endonuclease family protein n=1 Tax=Streptomyces canus TaxID=58343 RepID=UPI0033BACBD6